MPNTTIREVTLDVGVSNIPIQSVPAKQFDLASRFLKVKFTDKGQPIIPTANSVVVINAERPDQESASFEGVINADGSVTVPITKWMLMQDGTVNVDISIIDGTSGRLTTLSFLRIEVDRTAHDVLEDEPGEEEINIVVSLIAQNQALRQNLNTLLTQTQTALAQCQTALNALTKGPIQSTEGSNLNTRLVALETWKANIEDGQTRVPYAKPEADQPTSLVDAMNEEG